MTILQPETAADTPARPAQPTLQWLADSKVPQGQTDELLTWLHKVNQKKALLRGSRQRDLRKECLLESARQTAQRVLEAKQRERMARWRALMGARQEPEPAQEAESLCDCDTCVLCQRHRSSMYGKCYCNVIFSPRPVFMDFSSQTVSATEAFTDEEESLQVDQFLASLNTKRKAEPDSEESLAGRKRAKA